MRFPTPVFQAPDSPSTPAPASATPASTPSTPSTTPTPDSTSLPLPIPSGVDSLPSDGVDSPSDPFGFMFGEENGDPLGGLDGSSPSASVTSVPKPTQPAQAEPVKPAATASEPAKPTAEPATPTPTEPTSPATAEPSPNLDPYDPGALARHLTENEEQVVQHVADNLFKLSDKDAEELESNAIGTIPKLLARAFVASQRNFLMQMQNIVPMMVQRQGEVTRRHSEAENEFYTRWPDLKKDQHGDLVTKYARVYRQMNPQTTRKEMIEALGPMVMMAAKVVPSVQQPGASTAQVSPMTNGNGRPPPSAPFVPAGPSAGGAFPTTKPELSPVESMFVLDE